MIAERTEIVISLSTDDLTQNFLDRIKELYPGQQIELRITNVGQSTNEDLASNVTNIANLKRSIKDFSDGNVTIFTVSELEGLVTEHK